MSCATLDIARVRDGLHLIDLEKGPVFRVTEPVAVVPCYPDSFGRWTNYFTDDRSLDRILSHGSRADGIDMIPLGHDIGVGVIPLSLIDVAPLSAWTVPDRAPGCVPWATLEVAWSRIVPSYWAIRSYSESDNPDAFWCHAWPPGVSFGEIVSWEFWT